MSVKMEINKEEIEKPFNMHVVEVKEQISKVIGEAKLPATVIQMVLREIANAIDVQVKVILDKEKEEYNKRLKGDK